MSALKSRGNLKVGLITSVLALMLLTEPILSAGKGGHGGGGGSQRSQQSQPSPSAPRVQSSPSVSRAPSRVTTPAPSVRPETRLSTSSSPGSSTPSMTFRPSNRQPDRMVTSPSSTPAAPTPQPRPVTSSSQPSITSSSRYITREQPTISSSVRTPPVGGSSNEGKQYVSTSETPSAPREGNRIAPDKANRIGNAIGKENPAPPSLSRQAAPTVEKQPSISSSNPIGRGGIGRTDSLVSEKKPSAPTTDGRATTADYRLPIENRKSKIENIGSPIGREKDGGPAKEKRSSKDSSKPVSTDKTEPANSSIGNEQPSVSSMDGSRQVGTSRGGSRTDSQRTSRTDGPAADKKSPVPDTIRDGRRDVHKVDAPEKAQMDGGKTLTKPEAIDKDGGKRTEAIQKHGVAGLRDTDRKSVSSRFSKRDSENQKTIINNNIVNHIDGSKTRVRRSERVGSSRVVYEDCVGLMGHAYHHEHVYFDRHERMCHRIIWPEYRYLVRYNWGPCWTFRYVYPYYHRKYVFVSLCGYWPEEYTCARYYWYGCHPYIWSGYYPIPYEVQGDTYNYYTYNYPDNQAGTTTTAEPSQTTNYIKPVDHTTFADVREKLARQQAAQPDQATLADTYFEEAVKTFEVNDYDTAIVKFARASELAPDDMILPFAYAQALMANEQYTESAQVLRAALAKVSPEKEGVFYPRGLYSSDEILFEQIDRLAEKAEIYSFDADLQLLLGYQLLGIGEIDEAAEPLRQASEDLENAPAAAVLSKVLEKIRVNPDVSGQSTD